MTILDAARPQPGTAPADDRRTLRLQQQLDQCHRDGTTLVLEGSGVSDYLVTEAGQLRYLLPFLAGWADNRAMGAVVYSLGQGGRSLAVPGAAPVELPALQDETHMSTELERIIECLRATTTPVLLIIDHLEGPLPGEAGPAGGLEAARLVELLGDLARDRRWREAGHRLVLIARTGRITARLTSQPGFLLHQLELPDRLERDIAIRGMVGSHRLPLMLAPDIDQARAGQLTGGLFLEDLARLRAGASAVSPVTAQQIIVKKNAALRRMADDTLQTHDQPLSLQDDVAGLAQVRRLVEEAKATDNLSVRVVLAGPPGNGKTRSSTALAWALGVPAVTMARIRASYVGQSEDNMDRALGAITAMAPLLLIIDECDEAGLGRRSHHSGDGGSEVTASLRARLFAWLGDNGERLGISVVGLTNRPDRLDPAAIDRFWLVPVLHPTADEAARIMVIQAQRQRVAIDYDTARDALREFGGQLSGRRAVGLVERAAIRAALDGRRDVNGWDIRQALGECLVHLSSDEEHQALLAIAHTTWTAHLPWVAARHLGLEPQVPPYMQPFVRADGGVDLSKLGERLRELERTLVR